MKRAFAVCGIVVALFVLFDLANLAFGQDRLNLAGERQLRKLPDLEEIAALRCGDYFLCGPSAEGTDPTIRIGVFLRKRASDPADVSLAFAFKPEVFEVVIDNAKKVPTAEIVLDVGGGNKIILRISQRDYDRSPCLVRTKKVKGVSV